jgi:hypothetical protein
MAKPQFTEAELKRRWREIQRDRCGSSALKSIKDAGWDLSAIPLDDHTWPAIISAIPSLANRKAGSEPQPAPKESAQRIILWLRQVAGAGEEGCVVEARDPHERTTYMGGAKEIAPARLRDVADAIEDLALRKRWVLTRHNPQQNAIASLRWTVRERCGRPMDDEILDLLDAAFRAAGKESGVPFTVEALKKVETTERKTRVSGRKKLLGNQFP